VQTVPHSETSNHDHTTEEKEKGNEAMNEDAREIQVRISAQVEAIATLVKRVESMPHVLRQGKGDWVRAIDILLDLVETPNNVDALWVWSAFAQAFGQGDTWQAERAFNVLLNWTATRRLMIESIAEGNNDDAIANLKDKLKDAELHCFTMLEFVLANFKKWRDLPDFIAHKRSLQPVDEPATTEVQP
jgi:hypothetical protein